MDCITDAYDKICFSNEEVNTQITENKQEREETHSFPDSVKYKNITTTAILKKIVLQAISVQPPFTISG